MKILWADTAKSHLLHLDRYLFEKSPAGADRVVDRILEIVASLEHFPLAGHPGRVAGTREIAVPGTKYLIAYRIVDRAVQILAVMHGAQRWPETFNP